MPRKRRQPCEFCAHPIDPANLAICPECGADLSEPSLRAHMHTLRGGLMGASVLAAAVSALNTLFVLTLAAAGPLAAIWLPITIGPLLAALAGWIIGARTRPHATRERVIWMKTAIAAAAALATLEAGLLALAILLTAAS